MFFIRAAFFALCFLSAASMPARAAGNMPTGAWVVGPINAASSSGLAYCSMKNSFENGITLVFARDSALTNSIALDFGRSALTPGSQYNLLIEVGYVSRSMISVAVTDQVLIVQMGVDEEFYDAVGEKGVLMVSFANQSFAFGLRGSSDALIALTECAEALEKGKVFATEEFTPPPESDISIGAQTTDKIFRDQIEELEAEKRRLMLENQAILAESQANAQAEALRLENERLKKELALREKEPSAETPKPAKKPAQVKSEKKPFKSVIPDILADAGIVGQKEKDGIYTWQAGGIFAAAEERPLDDGETLGTAAARYADAAEARCAGDFARKISDVKKIGKYTAATGEMACLDGSSDGAAALLFLVKNDMFVVITQEGVAAVMEQALYRRDGIAGSLEN